MKKPLYCSKHANMWKGRYHGRKVAAKAPSVDPWTDLKRMRTVGDLPSHIYVNELAVSHTEVLCGSRDMEVPSPSEHTAVVGCDDG
jgi:hypothetical protein